MGLKWRNRSATDGGAWGRRFLRPVPQVGIGMGRRSVPGSGSETLAANDVVRGSAATINPSVLLQAASGAYSATGLPLGLSIDSGTGVISGTPKQWRPRSDVVVTRGAATSTYPVGCTAETGMPCPISTAYNLDVATVSVWDTDVTAADVAAIKAAIVTATNDTGTSATPKYHRITYTGADISGEIFNSDSTAANANRDYTHIVVAGAGKKVNHLRYSYKYTQIVWENWIILGWGGQANPNAVYSANALYSLRKCKIGPWWDTVPFLEENADLIRWTSGGLQLTVEACEIAGWLQGGACNLGGNGKGYFVGNFIHHCGEDIWRAFGGGSGDVMNIWSVGNTAHRWVNIDSRRHTDFIQTGAQTASGFATYLQSFGDVIVMDDTRYGSTGIRLQHEGGFLPTACSLDVKGSTYAITGYDGITANTPLVNLDGFIVAPAPGFGGEGQRIRLAGAAGLGINVASAYANVARSELLFEGDWVGDELTVTGADVSWTANNEAQIEADFPLMTGAVVAFARHGTHGASSVYVPAEVDSYLHPTAVRDMASTVFRPGASWTGFRDPGAAFPLESLWPSVPASSAPVISSFAATGYSATLSTTGANGLLWYMVTTSSTAPMFAELRSGVEADGDFTGPIDSGGPATSGVVTYGRQVVSASGSQTITLSVADYLDGSTYYVYVLHETRDGLTSGVQSATMVVSLYDFTNNTPTKTQAASNTVTQITDGWTWDYNTTTTNAIYWPIDGVMTAGVSYRLRFTATTVGTVLPTVRGAANTALSTVRGLSSQTLADGGPTDHDYTFTATTDTDYLGFRLVTPVGDEELTVINMTLLPA